MEEIKRRVLEAAELAKKHIGFTAKDVEALHSEAEKVEPHLHGVAVRVTEALLRDPDAAAIVERSGLTFDRAVRLYEDWMRNMLFRGSYDEQHVYGIFRIGLVHVKVGVDERLMAGHMGALARELLPFVGAKEPLLKALAWSLSVMLYSYEYIKNLVFRDTIGVSTGLEERLFSLATRDLFSKLGEER